ncbi:hypothetical protein D3C71_1868660 [compost metagenome]
MDGREIHTEQLSFITKPEPTNLHEVPITSQIDHESVTYSLRHDRPLLAEAVWKRFRRSGMPSIRITRATASLAGHPVVVDGHEWI